VIRCAVYLLKRDSPEPQSLGTFCLQRVPRRGELLSVHSPATDPTRFQVLGVEHHLRPREEGACVMEQDAESAATLMVEEEG